MIDASQWDAVLSTVTGTIYRGHERIGSAALLDLLQVGSDPGARQKAGKLLRTAMKRLGWNGPRAMRIPAESGHGAGSNGYWRLPSRPPGGLREVDSEADTILSDDLPSALEEVTRLGLRKMARVLRAPMDFTDGNLLRAQITAAVAAVNAQLRADEQRLRAKAAGDALEKLLRAIDRTRGRVVEDGGGQAAGEFEAFSLGDLAEEEPRADTTERGGVSS